MIYNDADMRRAYALGFWVGAAAGGLGMLGLGLLIGVWVT